MGALQGKTAVVTGAAQGIGAAYSRTLAEAGAAVVVADINLEGAKEVAAGLQEAGGEAAAMEVDVSSRESTRSLADQVRARFGAADILVNNAAIYHSMRRDSMLEVDVEYWRKVFSVNLDGALLMTQAIAPLMIERGWGRIVNQTSSAAYLGGGGHYGCSKLALIGLTQGFARELGPSGVTVNALAPGPIFNEATRATVPDQVLQAVLAQAAIPKEGQADDLFAALHFLVSDGASWVTGQVLVVDGGIVKRL